MNFYRIGPYTSFAEYYKSINTDEYSRPIATGNFVGELKYTECRAGGWVVWEWTVLPDLKPRSPGWACLISGVSNETAAVQFIMETIENRLSAVMYAVNQIRNFNV